jgi:alanine-glyoxylate transaminase / serine-glyoxylate transaminase / serine-pyruvate transaminase
MTDRGKELIGELLPPQRLMMTPGPSCVDPRVYRAMAAPIVGHMDPWFTQMMEDVQEMLRRVFQTQNRITFPISASGSGGIEAAVMNALDAGDECIVCINGAFSERMAIIADRIPARARKSSLLAWRMERLLPASFSESRITAKSPMNWARYW